MHDELNNMTLMFMFYYDKTRDENEINKNHPSENNKQYTTFLDYLAKKIG